MEYSARCVEPKTEQRAHRIANVYVHNIDLFRVCRCGLFSAASHSASVVERRTNIAPNTMFPQATRTHTHNSTQHSTQPTVHGAARHRFTKNGGSSAQAAACCCKANKSRFTLRLSNSKYRNWTEPRLTSFSPFDK